MRYSAFGLVWALLAGPLFAGGGGGIQLGNPVEVVKLPKSALPALSSVAPLIRLSPDGTRALMLRRAAGGAGVIPHVGQIGQDKALQPVPWDGHGIAHVYALMGLSGNVWRADGQRVLFLQPRMQDEGGPVEHYERTMSPWAMCWDKANPQCSLCRHMRLDRDLGCTSLSYSADGSMLWTAYGDPGEFKRCGITGWDRRRGRGATYYKADNAGVFRLVPSPDGEHLAWLEQSPGADGRRRTAKVELVVFALQAKKVVTRLPLGKGIWAWTQAPAPVWTADSKAVCYGDVEQIDRIHRRVVRLWRSDGSEPKELARDAVAVGASRAGVVLNRGPACMPMVQLTSSFAPRSDPRPKRDEVVVATAAGVQTLVPDAYAQQADRDRIVYAKINGGDVLIMTARWKATVR
jgi:hypothetical protein